MRLAAGSGGSSARSQRQGVSIMRRNLKEAGSKTLNRQTKIADKAVQNCSQITLLPIPGLPFKGAERNRSGPASSGISTSASHPLLRVLPKSSVSSSSSLK
jgi:hypothetical protein